MKNKELPPLVRVALYIRVSGEEQKIKGLSLEAQQERLEAYAREKGWIVTGVYIDAAKTARKNMHKRAEFQKMIESVKRNEVDLLLFCRLDRWFRSVADYYKVMEILQAHGCDWKTIDEEYDTTTANGRLYINVKLSIAQNEADICGERIDVVFDSKIAHGTVVSGSCPFGYRVNEEKRLEVLPEEAGIVQDAFSFFESKVSQLATVKHIRETYGVNWCTATFRRMLSETLYTGIYDRGGRRNEDFCPAIISKEQFDRVQVLLKRNARSAPSGRVYIFTSILKCAECNHNMVGRIAYKGSELYYSFLPRLCYGPLAITFVMMTVCCFETYKFKVLQKIFGFLGEMTLEIYLLNSRLIGFFDELATKITGNNDNCKIVLANVLGVTTTIILALYIHKIITKMRNQKLCNRIRIGKQKAEIVKKINLG